MKRIIAILILAVLVGVGVSRCGKLGGEAAGGNITFYGAGS